MKHYSVEQYECDVCDHIGRAVKSTQNNTPAQTVEYHHLSCSKCNEPIVHLDQHDFDDAGFDDDGGELD